MLGDKHALPPHVALRRSPTTASAISSITTLPTAIPCRDGHGRFVVLASLTGPRRRLVSDALVARGIRVATVGSLHDLRTASIRWRPDAVVVDADLARPGVDILEFVRTAGVPLIMTSVASAALRARLLLVGADDCLPVRFAPEELAARTVAVIRRAYGDDSPESAVVLQSGSIRIDVRARRVTVRGLDAPLTVREFDLLSCMVRHSGETLSRDRLLIEVWGYTSGDQSTVTVHVRRLRCRVEAEPSRPQFIQTVRGVGYRWCADDRPTGIASPTMLPDVASHMTAVAHRR